MFDVHTLITSFGFFGLLAIIFMETGVLIGFIFPGDTLLFMAGILASQPDPFAPIWAICLGIPIAAALGDQVGFFIGRKVGPAIVHSRMMTWIGPEALDKTNRYFDRFGATTVMVARFIGIVRTLTPIVAGFSNMKHGVFTLWSVIGCIIWGGGIPLLGYYLGAVPLVADHAQWFILLGVLSVLIPLGYQVFKVRQRSARERNEIRQRRREQAQRRTKSTSAD